MPQYNYIEGGIVAPKGFLASGVSAGVKKSGKRDVCVIAAEQAVPAAAVFTKNALAAPPVQVSRRHVADGRLRAIVANSGNANACTGQQGIADAEAMAAATADALGCEPEDVFVASTGVIGERLPMQALMTGIADAVEALDNADGDAAAEAIMTTDTFLKQVAVSFEVQGSRYAVAGIAKGSGMIMPNMATMLAFLTTDAPLTPEACAEALLSATEKTFNRISVDGDTSTNDCAVLIASGAAAGPPIKPETAAFAEVSEAIEHVSAELARMLVRDGEGATKFITVTVCGAASENDAFSSAMAIANSSLFKTAIFGGDANWGRVAMAIGNSSAVIDPDRLEITFAGLTTCLDGMAISFDEEAASAALSEPEVDVVVDLHVGECEATVWTCDLSYDYVRINGDYRT
ncbi:MAG: bifunctional glutamate N-acetyltransferase/amino-acid acetyltransferase ArgJ [Coriobacteriia bacterium]|nr:bifunctional glutamate N-acetyltransferase/amino-acid acetyltransferase ArgJ [Coriobacteriia bacterium]